MRFTGKVAIVTGGASGIGKATARRLGAEGCRVLIADVAANGPQVAEEMVAEGLDVIFQDADVSQESQVAALVETVLKKWQRLDVMVVNAGIGGRGLADETRQEDWERVMGINLTGVFLCTKHAVPAMRRTGGGAIVNTASVMGLVAPRGAVPYASTKGAVVNMTRATAVDYARENIRINAVCPGHLEAPTSLGGAAARAMDNRELLDRYPMGRLGKPEDVANAIAFLASEEAAFITGISLVVDGGYSAQ